MLVLMVALAWLLIAVPVGLIVGGTLFLAELLDDWLPPPRLGPLVLFVTVGLTVSITGAAIAWLVMQVPNRRTLSISLVAAALLLALTIALHLVQRTITAGPDLLVVGFVAVASAVAVWQTRPESRSG